MMKRRHLNIQSVYIHMTLILRIRKTKFFLSVLLVWIRQSVWNQMYINI